MSPFAGMHIDLEANLSMTDDDELWNYWPPSLLLQADGKPTVRKVTSGILCRSSLQGLSGKQYNAPLAAACGHGIDIIRLFVILVEMAARFSAAGRSASLSVPMSTVYFTREAAYS